jgi:hypothetical protein
MTKLKIQLFLLFFLSLISAKIDSQKFFLPFGDIKGDELSNRPYKPDPGADAIIISDIGIASLNYANEFYIELERDVRIKIVNSNGFDYANIEIPYSTDDIMEGYRASTFNTRNGEKIETTIPKENFIVDKTTKNSRTLKFSFTDVHEGSVIEYSYKIMLKGYSYLVLVPWVFQSEIPVVFSSISVSYPEYFIYKNIISGSTQFVRSSVKTSESNFFSERVKVFNNMYYAENVPAFRIEPYIKSIGEHLTKITFELAKVNIPNQSLQEITPTYATLTNKLLGREDFGDALKSNFKNIAEDLTAGISNDLLKLQKIHKHISSKILWNTVEDFTSSGSLKSVYNKGKGNSADINMILICMLRALKIKADPVILSTRSNGSINEFSAMIQQFNYLVAYVTIDSVNYLVDATDPLRPFNVLPFECLNGTGRLISEKDSKFVRLENKEAYSTSTFLKVAIDKTGKIEGSAENIYSGYPSLNIRKLIKIESEEGYSDIVRSLYSDFDFTGFGIENTDDPNADIKVKFGFKTVTGTQVAGNGIIFFPGFADKGKKSPFYSQERNYPVDFGCPTFENYRITVKIPEGYIVEEKPWDTSKILGKNDGKFEFSTEVSGGILEIKSSFTINKTIFQVAEYKNLQDFYTEFLKKQSEPVVFRKSDKNL